MVLMLMLIRYGVATHDDNAPSLHGSMRVRMQPLVHMQQAQRGRALAPWRVTDIGHVGYRRGMLYREYSG